MSTYTVKQIAKLAGVSVRTLHHYHEAGLLVPRNIGANGYRYYSESEALRLQQIMLYRGFGLGLTEIRSILDAPDFDALKALQQHKARLEDQAKRLPELIATLDCTIKTLIGGRKMSIEQLYRAFPPEKQAAYEDELKAMGADMAAQVAKSNAKIAQKTEGDMEASLQELQDIEAAIIANMHAGSAPEAIENAPHIQRHRAWVSAMWGRDCAPEAHIGLAQMYESHPDFIQRYETLATGFTAYICAAIRAHAR